jgi:hypothetical protein
MNKLLPESLKPMPILSAFPSFHRLRYIRVHTPQTESNPVHSGKTAPTLVLTRSVPSVLSIFLDLSKF